MVSREFPKSIAQGYIFLANLLNTTRIEKLVVPSVVQAGSPSVVLDCQFSASDQFTLQWWFCSRDHRSALVYQWTPPLPPEAMGVLEGRTDVDYKVSFLPFEEYRAIRLLKVDPQLSGEYTCVVISNGIQARGAKRMLVFSPEEEFEMTMNRKSNNSADITCAARGVYPQPDLLLELDKEPIPRQVQRVWHMTSLVKYDAETKGQVPAPRCGRPLAVTCRLRLPQAEYTAIKKQTYSFDEECNEGQNYWPMNPVTMLFIAYFLRFCN